MVYGIGLTLGEVLREMVFGNSKKVPALLRAFRAVEAQGQVDIRKVVERALSLFPCLQHLLSQVMSEAQFSVDKNMGLS